MNFFSHEAWIEMRISNAVCILFINEQWRNRWCHVTGEVYLVRRSAARVKSLFITYINVTLHVSCDLLWAANHCVTKLHWTVNITFMDRWMTAHSCLRQELYVNKPQCIRHPSIYIYLRLAKEYLTIQHGTNIACIIVWDPFFSE
jgi:hypothetical protein